MPRWSIVSIVVCSIGADQLSSETGSSFRGFGVGIVKIELDDCGGIIPPSNLASSYYIEWFRRFFDFNHCQKKILVFWVVLGVNVPLSLM